MASVNVGDAVMVPGDMHGVVKFIGPVAGKKGIFAGVQLATEYAPRGKNSGEVDGRFYFKTTIPGSGIFLPVEKAVKKPGSAGGGLGMRASPGPGTPTRLSSFNQGGRTPGLAKPNFSQSVGPGMRHGAASPALKPPMRRESLPRPSSPLRKVNTPTPRTTLATPKTRPSGIGLAKSTHGGPGQYRPGGRPSNNFSQSLRQTATGSGASPSLGPEASFDETSEQDAESTPTPTPNVGRVADLNTEKYEARIRDLTLELDEARRQLREQGANFTEMEGSFNELQRLLPVLEEGNRGNREDDDDEELPRDVVSLRDTLREKNDKIKLLTAEFDANRADFRSTIDTLEMASSETERVYEKRVDDLLEEVRNLQDRSEDVETVAQQLKQLEELVQELEEGLEDARRGEAEARGEVEFLRGEVERSRSELRRERERLKTEEQLSGYSPGNLQDLETQLNAKDDEIRGLKAIIQNLNQSSPRTNGGANGGHARHDSQDDDALQQQIRDLEQLLQQKSAHEEELANEVKQLRNSVTMSKFPLPGSAFGIHTGIRTGASDSRGNSEDLDRKHLSTGTQGSQRTVVLGAKSHERKQSQQFPEAWRDADSRDASPVKHDEYVPNSARSDAGVTDISSASTPLWCEICEEGGHDILTCSNMFGPGKKDESSPVGSWGKRNGMDAMRDAVKMHAEEGHLGDGGDSSALTARQGDPPDRPAPLVSRKNTSNTVTSLTSPSNPPPTASLPPPPSRTPDHPQSQSSPVKASPPRGPSPAPATSGPPKLIEGTGDQAGMLAGRTTGAIDPEKWCAFCERDGHESVDCPLEDAF